MALLVGAELPRELAHVNPQADGAEQSASLILHPEIREGGDPGGIGRVAVDVHLKGNGRAAQPVVPAVAGVAGGHGLEHPVGVVVPAAALGHEEGRGDAVLAEQVAQVLHHLGLVALALLHPLAQERVAGHRGRHQHRPGEAALQISGDRLGSERQGGVGELAVEGAAQAEVAQGAGATETEQQQQAHGGQEGKALQGGQDARARWRGGAGLGMHGMAFTTHSRASNA
jgi:hypothetical protein